MQNGVGKGSCRSFGGFNLYEALEYNKDCILNFGGHELAAGLTIESSKVDEFRERMGRYYSEIANMPDVPELKIDFEARKAELLTIENVRALSGLEPFGTDNLSPVICFYNAEIVSIIPICAGKHTKMWICKDGTVFECVFFSKSVEDLGFKEGNRVNVAFTPQINEFRGRCNVQLNLIDAVRV